MKEIEITRTVEKVFLIKKLSRYDLWPNLVKETF